MNLLKIVEIADRIVSDETFRDLAVMKEQIGIEITQTKLTALVAVNMFMRIAGLEAQVEMTRSLSPIEPLVEKGLVLLIATQS